MADISRVENFSNHMHQITIKEEGKIYTACQDGKIPFVSTRDIAAVTFHALTDIEPHNTDYRIFGPELLTYNEVFSRLLGLVLGVNAKSDSFHAGCSRVQQRSRTPGRACQVLRARKGSTVHEHGYAGTACEVHHLPRSLRYQRCRR